MTAEDVSSRLRSLYLDRCPTPTPVRIQQHINNSRKVESFADKICFPIPRDILEATIFPRGLFAYDKFANLRDSAKRILETQGAKALDVLDASCIKENGKISERKLRRKLRERRNKLISGNGGTKLNI